MVPLCHLPQQLPLPVLPDDGIRREPVRQLQNMEKNGVKGAEGNAGRISSQFFTPLPHLRSCSSREGNHEYVSRVYAAFPDEILHTSGNDRRFPRARSRQDHHRAVPVGDGPSLYFTEFHALYLLRKGLPHPSRLRQPIFISLSASLYPSEFSPATLPCPAHRESRWRRPASSAFRKGRYGSAT